MLIQIFLLSKCPRHFFQSYYRPVLVMLQPLLVVLTERPVPLHHLGGTAVQTVHPRRLSLLGHGVYKSPVRETEVL